MEQAIKEFIGLKRLAVVGVSRNANKFGNTIHKELKTRGYKVFGVNPSMSQLNGEKCYSSVTSLEGMVDGVVVCVSPDKVEPVMKEVAAAGLRHVWLQQGAENENSVERAKDLGLKVVKGKCILMYAEPINSFHKVHKLIVKIIGRL